MVHTWEWDPPVPLHDQGVENCELGAAINGVNAGRYIWRFGVLLAADAQAHNMMPALSRASRAEIAAVSGMNCPRFLLFRLKSLVQDRNAGSAKLLPSPKVACLRIVQNVVRIVAGSRSCPPVHCQAKQYGARPAGTSCKGR